MCKYYIIDNNVKTIDSILKTMEDFDEFKFIGNSCDYNKALNLLLKESPTLIFLNIDNLANSFQFVQDINLYSNDPIEFVALSNKKDKAYQTIKLSFCDFLLTPITDLEIRKTILNFQKKKLSRTSIQSICLKSYKDYQYLNTNEILFLKADNNTTEFHMNDGSIINAYKTLKTFEKRLPFEFSRIHKSYIINTKYVSRIQFGKCTCSIKRNSQDIPFTNTYLPTIQRMNNMLAGDSLAANLN